jgi:hypothetical protein
MILGEFFMSVILLTSCESSQCMKDYYTANKNSLVTIRTLSKTLADNNAFRKVTIKKKDVGVEIMFEGGDGDNATIYLNPSDLSLRSESVVDGCSSEALTRFRAMYNSNTLRDILNLFDDINPKALKISHRSIFVALGQPLKSKNPSLDGGILMTFQAGDTTDNKIVETIDTNVYLYDTLVY